MHGTTSDATDDPRGDRAIDLRQPAAEHGAQPGSAGSVSALVAAARGGDSRAWDALVERFLPLVTALIARHRLGRADADDVNQTVWLRLVEHLGDLREPEALPGFIARVTRNECLRALRAHQRSLPVDPQAASPFDRAPFDGGAFAGLPPDRGVDVGLDDDLLREERHHALREALHDLPSARRDLLTLLVADPPIPYAEISRRLGIPIGSIGPTRSRALAQLRSNPGLRALLDSDLALDPRG